MVKHALTWVKPHLAVGTSIRIDPTIAQDRIAECNIQTSGVTLNPRYLPTLAPCQGVITFVHEWTHGFRKVSVRATILLSQSRRLFTLVCLQLCKKRFSNVGC